MYYYIFDQPNGANEYQRTAEIKERLASLGIAGEMASPTPGRNVQQLVESAVQKRYATIVAVGGVTLINQVARAIEPHDLVMGIIPLQENPAINTLIGSTSWQDAAEQLKRRRWQYTRLGLLQESICFLTPAEVSFPETVEYAIRTKAFTLREKGGTVRVTPLRGTEDQPGSLILEIEHPIKKRRGFLKNVFAGQEDPSANTVLQVDSLELQTDKPHDVRVAGDTVCQTPLTCSTQDKPLRLIVARSGSAPQA